MGLTFDQAYFEDGAGGFVGYRDFPHFEGRAAWLVDRYGVDADLAEVGAGFGYTVRHLRARGMTAAVGYDNSVHAVAADLSCADLVVLADVGTVDLAGMDPIVSWNLLDCLRDEADAARVAANLQAYGATEQMHAICVDDDNGGSFAKDGYLIRSADFWKGLFDTEGTILIEYASRKVWRLQSGVWSTVTGLAVPLSWQWESD